MNSNTIPLSIYKAFSAIAVTLAVLTYSVFNTAYADAGDRLIQFSGLNSAQTQNAISVKNLEQNFALFSTKMYNPWDKKTARYTGILISDLVNKLGKSNTQKITFKAIDDYEVTLTKEMWTTEPILLVTKENGSHIHMANKGPMRIVFPNYDPKQKHYEQNLPLWMWMITRINFE